jgi:methionine sulfoxide reductase heme-binding subunit
MNARMFPLLVAALLSIGAVGLAVMIGGDSLEQARLAARWTARVGFPVFILTYSASSLVRLWPHDIWKTLLRYRRQWGLGFALTHSVHLVALSLYNSLAHSVPTLVTLAGGGGAYVILYAMAFTSNTASMRALGVWWKRLHTLGIHWLWFVFTFSYAGRLFDPERMMQGLILFPICLAALGLRIAAALSARRKRASAAA